MFLFLKTKKSLKREHNLFLYKNYWVSYAPTCWGVGLSKTFECLFMMEERTWCGCELILWLVYIL